MALAEQKADGNEMEKKSFVSLTPVSKKQNSIVLEEV